MEGSTKCNQVFLVSRDGLGGLSLAVPWGCLRFVIVVFPDHTHYF